MLQIYDRVLASRSVPTLVALSIFLVGAYAFQGLFDVIRSRGRRTAPLIFPIHLLRRLDGSRVQVIKPLGYFEFMALVRRARFVMTDSGGVQEETTYLRNK